MLPIVPVRYSQGPNPIPNPNPWLYRTLAIAGRHRSYAYFSLNRLEYWNYSGLSPRLRAWRFERAIVHHLNQVCCLLTKIKHVHHLVVIQTLDVLAVETHEKVAR